jgi:predicted transcriptional regulator
VQRLQQLAATRQRTPEVLVREAIEQYVTREERRAQFDRDTLAALNEYEADGLHVTEEEADAWLAKLEAGEDADPPECHL